MLAAAAAYYTAVAAAANALFWPTFSTTPSAAAASTGTASQGAAKSAACETMSIAKRTGVAATYNLGVYQLMTCRSKLSPPAGSPNQPALWTDCRLPDARRNAVVTPPPKDAAGDAASIAAAPSPPPPSPPPPPPPPPSPPHPVAAATGAAAPSMPPPPSPPPPWYRRRQWTAAAQRHSPDGYGKNANGAIVYCRAKNRDDPNLVVFRWDTAYAHAEQVERARPRRQRMLRHFRRQRRVLLDVTWDAAQVRQALPRLCRHVQWQLQCMSAGCASP